VTPQVIVLNGGSGAGKSGIARCLQAVRPAPWLALGVGTAGPGSGHGWPWEWARLALGVGTLIQAMPVSRGD
jgi:hypothetical protein